jgi:glycogen debranching enzyme
MSDQERSQLWQLGFNSIKELEAPLGILASARNEAYGCIFGRDSLITGLELLEAYKRTNNPYFLELVKKILTNLALLQGTEVQIESGEEPGKIIHEFRPDKHEHLTSRDPQGLPTHERAWYVYPDNQMRNYDSVDSTPLFLVTLHRYWQISGDDDFINTLLPSVLAALNWMTEYGDTNGDGFIDYRFHPDRTFGGLKSQSWMDSNESLFYEQSEEFPLYPIAPVEVQAYAYAALRAWGDYFTATDTAYAQLLAKKAAALKELFNKKYVIAHGKRVTLAFALDGSGKQLTAARSSMGHVLFAAYQGESILDAQYVEPLRLRLLSRDMFIPSAGVRTLSSRSLHYDPLSYHNGSIWPHDTAMLAQGLRNFGYEDDAKRVESALLKAYMHFKTPIELFGYQKGYRTYAHANGSGACLVQAWSAASLLAIVGVPAL